MVYITFNNKTIEYSDDILNISTYIKDCIKYKTDINEPIILIGKFSDRIFNLFDNWFQEFRKIKFKKYTETYDIVFIFKPEIFYNLDIQTLLDLFNFGLGNQIKLLCETITYVLGNMNLKLCDLYNKYFIYCPEQDHKLYPIHIVLAMMILKHMTNKNYNIQEDKIKKLIKYNKLKIIEYNSYSDQITNKNIFRGSKLGYENEKYYGINYGLKYIRDEAFGNCRNMKYIEIPTTITRIGKSVFEYCKNLTNIIIPNSIVKIGLGAFDCCRSLTQIQLPNSLTYLGNGTFSYCENLKSISLPSQLTKIGINMFAECKQLTNIEIPNSIVRIDDAAFVDCISLESINLPTNLSYIGHEAFLGCIKLKSINIPNSVVSLYAGSFFKCKSLESVTLSTSINKIHDETFKNCFSLKHINIPNSVTEISIDCFECCTSLEMLILPSSVDKLDVSAFDLCKKLMVVFDNGLLKIPENVENFIVPKYITKIYNDVIEYPLKLKSMSIPMSTIFYDEVKEEFEYQNIKIIKY